MEKTTLHTSVSMLYVPKWGIKEGIREVMQNALDADQKGHEMEVGYNATDMKISISNTGSRLSLTDFLIGATDKNKDEEQIGSHGEGFKVGSIALLRAGKSVRIHNQLEGDVFQMKVAESSVFGGKVLAVEVMDEKDVGDKLVFEVGGITNGEWGELKKQFLWNHDYEKIETVRGEILLGSAMKGMVYCGGLFVSMVDDLAYGYNIKPKYLKLDRDRRVLDWYDTRWVTTRMWSEVSEDHTFEIANMLMDDSKDVEFIKYEIKKDAVKDLIMQIMGQETGVFPVTTDYERTRVERCGLRGVTVNYTTAKTLEVHYGTIDELERVTKFRSERCIMKPEHSDKVSWAIEKFSIIDSSFPLKVGAVNFYNDAVKSYMDGDELLICVSALGSRVDVLGEIVKWYAGNNNQEERELWKSLFNLYVMD